ncbi:DUF6777 domain-containing protein [Streptomyces sp. SPB162]|uniref:DUF6777 domain-containing protein n=1 Tax=Streptomyces sp. SPB162 TaxID=2940560 RepID=UPI002407201E|nr:DUF6777 domain-containing protein [Streptomyces sp. SPB162]
MPQQEPPTQSGQGGTPDGPEDTGGGGWGGGGGGDGHGGDGNGAHSGGPGDHRPWWRSAPRVALIGIALVAIVALVVLLTRPDKKSDVTSGGSTSTGSEVLLQPAAAAGPDPFTRSTAKDSSEPASASPQPSLLSGGADGSTAQGSAAGLYGGTFNTSSCDVERQIDFLTSDSAKARAFADVEDIEPAEIPAYLRSLTPVQLRTDTSVTNHGFKAGKATAFPSVLQAGTAVLVGDHGEPRVRCACGNPLQPPTSAPQNAKTTGQAWPSYNASQVVSVEDASDTVDVFVLYDAQKEEWFNRPRGDTGATDSLTKRPTSVPTTHSPTPSSQPSTTHSTSPTPSTSKPTTTTPPTTTPPTPTTTPPTTSAPPPEPPAS